jgi:arylsulfatase A-like enzyme
MIRFPLLLALLAAPLAAAKPNIIVILADDLGYADLACQGQEKDVFTPNLDRFAAQGIRCTAGYTTAPQCSPARAGLLTGRYQQRIGIDTIPDMPLGTDEVLIPEMLQPAGYTSGMVGKWHLEPNHLCKAWLAKNLPDAPLGPKGMVAIPNQMRLAYFPQAQGFDRYFTGEMGSYHANITLAGEPREPGPLAAKGFRIDIQTDAALAFIRGHHEAPFFLYLPYFAPHTPLEAPPKYAARFTEKMPARRRAALSMIAGIDHGVGRILDALAELGIDDNTLLVFTSDNGAPVHGRRDSPLNTDPGGWDGSLNTPWVGEKGMLAEGGIRVPFLVRWKGRLPAGKVSDYPVSSLDIAATARAAAGLPADPRLDGIDLVPALTASPPPPPRALHWRFWNQIAIREGKWKYLKASGGPDLLFDLDRPEHEKKNLAAEHPDILAKLRAKSDAWAATLQPAGVPQGKPVDQEIHWYQEYFQVQLDGPKR